MKCEIRLRETLNYRSFALLSIHSGKQLIKIIYQPASKILKIFLLLRETSVLPFRYIYSASYRLH